MAPLHSQGYSTVTSARPHTVFYAVPFFTFKQDGDASRLPPLTWGYIVAASVCFKARISHTVFYAVPFSSNKAGMPHGYLPGWGDASWMPPLSQGPHFLQNLPYWRKRSVRERHRKEPNFATRDRSNEASDCDLRPFPDPSAPLGIERWLRSQRASAPRELMPRLHSPCNKNSKGGVH